uniref:Putative homocysteine S-methyltransferase n=1 Tax=Trypanosoma congolense (strain IL3000) TaxID=1068625 RepID=G0UIW0_TRYCI|nr:putative homocysteine S-methyltransferase [Trypanosoma congolense IL3000]
MEGKSNNTSHGDGSSVNEPRKRPNFFVLDGAMGTEIEERRPDLLPLGPMWSASVVHTEPSAVQSVHEAYVNAGADILLTSTYQINTKGCATLGVAIPDLVDAAVRLLRNSITPERTSATEQAKAKAKLDPSVKRRGASAVFAPLLYGIRDDPSKCPVLIGGSMSPYGSLAGYGQEYHGKYTVDETIIDEFYNQRVRAFIDYTSDTPRPKVDFLMLETFPLLKEAVGVFSWLSHQRDGVLDTAPVCISFVSVLDGDRPSADADDAAVEEWWNSAESSIHLPDGNTYLQVLDTLMELRSPQLAGLGANCCSPLEVSVVASLLLKKKKKHVEDPSLVLLLYSNSGEEFTEGEWRWRHKFERGSRLSKWKRGTVVPQQELRRMMLAADVDVQLCGLFAYQTLLQRPEADDWLFDIVICGGCCRSNPKDIEKIRALA